MLPRQLAAFRKVSVPGWASALYAFPFEGLVKGMDSDRIEVHVVVGVSVCRHQAAVLHPPDLRPKFRLNLPGFKLALAQSPYDFSIRVKVACTVHQAGDLPGGQNRCSVAERQVDPDAEFGHTLHLRQCVLTRRLGDHQGSAAHHTGSMGMENSVGDAATPSKVVGVHNKPRRSIPISTHQFIRSSLDLRRSR